MGFSIAVIVFALSDADPLLRDMDWTLGTKPQDHCTELMCGASDDQYFYVYINLKAISSANMPDIAGISKIAPLTAHIVVETSMVASVEYYENGETVWTAWGIDGEPLTLEGPVPVDLNALVSDYRATLPESAEYSGMDEQIINEEGFALTNDFFVSLTGFRYNGDSNLQFFPIQGDLPLLKLNRRKG